ncbi:FeoA domain-containing protein [Patescibacteria group bacterium]|nr:FeoA domain-containing protein [Patescibacteria group bacterium]MBU1663726.1 FeoA domain-containing protein [Patescibacteria group bacterium]MBU1934278.1 FeoA domain-containing protein [Patescibacteria group bacterium]MBU2008153.1 FeoA domain-containing protein [Patescibacteria group bacterium]MBU2233867.1 FeoA domain-containing protein [Patescibacteria group bacterium]
MKESISLIEVEKDKEIEIVSIEAGLQATKRLFDLGLTPRTKIKILRKTISGPIEIELRGSKLVLGRGLASKIFIK